jgi:hypothetical protein
MATTIDFKYISALTNFIVKKVLQIKDYEIKQNI